MSPVIIVTKVNRVGYVQRARATMSCKERAWKSSGW